MNGLSLSELKSQKYDVLSSGNTDRSWWSIYTVKQKTILNIYICIYIIATMFDEGNGAWNKGNICLKIQCSVAALPAFRAGMYLCR